MGSGLSHKPRPTTALAFRMLWYFSWKDCSAVVPAAVPPQPLFWKEGKPLLQEECTSRPLPRHSFVLQLGRSRKGDENQTKPSHAASLGWGGNHTGTGQDGALGSWAKQQVASHLAAWQWDKMTRACMAVEHIKGGRNHGIPPQLLLLGIELLRNWAGQEE